MAEKAVAATLVAPKTFDYREYDLPEVQPDDGLLRMAAVGICGADIGTYQREVPKPRIIGHENVGYIAGIGTEAAKRWGVKEGDLVVPEEYIPCMHCKYCYTGRFRFCNNTDRGYGQIYRHGQTTADVWPALWGGFSQYMYLPPNTVMHTVAHPVSPHILALYLPLANGIEWAVRYGGASQGKTVLVQGPGQMGLMNAFAAKQAGADCVIVTGMTHDKVRLDMAKRLGADYTIDVQTEDFVERVKEITGSEGVDVVVNVAAGSKTTVAESIEVASKECTIVLAGAGDQPVSMGVAGSRKRRDLTIKIANGHGYSSVAESIEFLTSGKHTELEEISTHQFPLEQARYALDTAAGDGDPGAIHVTIMT
ncbi:MAG: alcohol dehydrogenase catalytic domain-containing protein [Dehalococcoidia bacterium]